MNIICKRFYETAADGTPVSYRTKYYRHFDGFRGRPCVGSKGNATHMDAALATQVCSQLNQIAGSGWTVTHPEATPERDKKAPKESTSQAAA